MKFMVTWKIAPAQQVPDEVMDELLAAYRTKRVNVTSTAT